MGFTVSADVFARLDADRKVSPAERERSAVYRMQMCART